MIQRLKFKVRFASTGKVITAEHEFHKGLTAITGPNESGKSLRIEMFRYALFGSRALRSSVSSYEEIGVEASFTINNDSYLVKRTGNSVKFYKNDALVASGTKPVNDSVIKHLGYDLDVFDSSNACLQGEVEALTQKTPTERKSMIDKTIGLETITGLITDYAKELTYLNKSRQDLSNQINFSDSLEEPVKPSGVSSKATLENSLALLRKDLSRRTQIESHLMALECKEPAIPEVTISESLDDLLKEQYSRTHTTTKLVHLKVELDSLMAIDVSNVEEQIKHLERYRDDNNYDKLIAYNEYNQRYSYLNVKPELSLEDLSSILKYYMYEEKIIRLNALENSNYVECPSCKTKFNQQHSEIQKLREEIPEDIISGGFKELSQKNGINTKAAAEEIYLTKLAFIDFVQDTPKPEQPYSFAVIKPEELKEKLELLNYKLQDHEKLKEIKVLISTLEHNLKGMRDDIDDVISTKKAETEALIKYEKEKASYDKFCEEANKLSPELLGLQMKDLEGQIKKTEATLNEFHQYEKEIAIFEEKKKAYELLKTRLDELDKLIEIKKAIIKSLKELRPRVANYLIPSLKRVASNLLSEMTNGSRRIVDISTDFEIKIDNQPVETLSGSGKAVANLAIRLALGTVLTNKVFSVLFADEVDASMDKDRAAFTASCLRNLTKVYNQIILVSHQKPQADHYIEL